jgi:osmotically-inducible protein OsmY
MVKADLQVQEDVMKELHWEPSVNAAHIGVEVHEGIVTLSGHVDTFAQKWRAEDAAKRVHGVKALAIDIHVQLLAGSERSDSDIARSANNVLRWSNDLRDNSVQVLVENGWITLTGFVEWAYQKKNLGYAICNLLGVTGLSNQLKIEPKVTLKNVRDDIEQVLKRRALAELKHVSIKVNGTEVVLAGHVSSWEEREAIHHSAWNTPGVQNVINEIKVA